MNNMIEQFQGVCESNQFYHSYLNGDDKCQLQIRNDFLMQDDGFSGSIEDLFTMKEQFTEFILNSNKLEEWFETIQ